MWNCKNCGHRLQRSDLWKCHNCGTRLTRSEAKLVSAFGVAVAILVTTFYVYPEILGSEIFYPLGVKQTSKEESLQAIEYINELRIQSGKNQIKWDPRVYALAVAWTEDMFENNYLDHTNPITGDCPYSLKENFEIQSNEFVADNSYSTNPKGGITPGFFNPDYKIVIKKWMASQAHRDNLLFDDHVSGAYACTGGKCTFMGLNYDRYVEGCFTKAGTRFLEVSTNT